jgi:hypothetical protein
MESNNGMPLLGVGGATSSGSAPLKAANSDATVIVDVEREVGGAGEEKLGIDGEGAALIFAKSLSSSEALPLGKE